MAHEGKPSVSETGRGARQGRESIGFLAILIGLLVVANIIGHYLYRRLDLTSNRLYSLSQGSRRLVADLDDTMEITTFFTSDLPPPFNATEQYVRNLLEEYAAASGGNVRLRFVDPDTDEEKEEAEREGVREVQHQAIEGNSVNIRAGYRGLSIRYLGERQTLPVIQDTQGLEYELTRAIRQLVREPLPIGILSGHEGPTPTKGLSSLRTALPSYTLREVNASTDIDSELRALLVVAPKTTIPQEELRRIHQFVMQGGSLGIFGGSMKVNLEGASPSAEPADSGLNQMLEGWGIQLGQDIVADARCGRVPMPTSIGLRIPVAYPPAPIVMFDDEAQAHPVLFRLPQAPFFFTSSIDVSDRFGELNGTVLGRSSEENSWLLTGTRVELRPRDPREWTLTGETGPHNVLVALSGKLPNAFRQAGVSSEGDQTAGPERAAREVRVLVSGSASMLRDEFLPQQQHGGQMTGALALALNAVDWLAQDQDLIAIRAKNIEDPTLDVPQSVRAAETEARSAAEEGDEGATAAALQRRQEALEAWETRMFQYKWGLTFGPALFMALLGVIRWRSRKSRRASIEAMRAELNQKRGQNA